MSRTISNTPRTLLSTAVATALLAGCGSSGHAAAGPNASRFKGDQRAVAQVVDDLTTAARGGSESTICDSLLTTAFAVRVGQGAGGCRREVKRHVVDPLAKFTVGAVRVRGELAAARVADRRGNQSLMVLAHHAGSWRIARIRVP